MDGEVWLASKRNKKDAFGEFVALIRLRRADSSTDYKPEAEGSSAASGL
jgi:hypothetical protein